MSILGIMVLGSIFGPLLLPSPLEQDLDSRYLKLQYSHPMGTDQFGRDMLARVLHGTRWSVIVGLTMGLTSGIIGGLVGFASGYIGGKFDVVLLRFIDALMAIPLIVLALTFLITLPDSRLGLVVSLSLAFTPLVARVTRSSALSLRSTGYVEASRAIGTPTSSVLLWHILPNGTGPWLIIIGAQIGSAILVESSLSFLGFGAVASNPSLGGLLSGEVQTNFYQAPWLAICPGITIILLVMGINMASDGLANVLSSTNIRKSS